MAGVNIVSPEDGATSMKDYWLHMVMFIVILNFLM
jgi:adenosine deaminase/adenosine deaminase CECR1